MRATYTPDGADHLQVRPRLVAAGHCRARTGAGPSPGRSGQRRRLVSDGTWTGAECAASWGVRTSTWLAYVSRGQAPPPLPGPDGGRRQWDPEAVRAFPRPGVGRARAGAAPEAVALLEEMAGVATRIAELRARQRDLARTGKARGVEVRAIARALQVSPQTVYGWLDGD